jgi:D-methionine transport system ATP-binding protein
MTATSLRRAALPGRVAPPAVHDAQGDAAHAVLFTRVSKRFGGGARNALDNVNLAVRRGGIAGIIGRSGAGKSTLLRLVNGLERPTDGSVQVWLDKPVAVEALDARGLIALRRRIGIVFQHFNLLSARTVRENIALPLTIAGMPRCMIDARVDAMLDLVGLVGKRDAYPGALSGGQKQRVGIARALVTDSDLLLCDEATSALDPETTQSILTLLRDINLRLGLTILLITHEMSVIREVCDTVAVVEQGRLVESGPVWRVFGEPRHEATRALLRPLVHDLPANLIARVRPESHTDAPRVVLDLRYTGASGIEPDLAALARTLGGAGDAGAVAFLHGSIERIQGRAQGRLVVAAGAAAPGVLTDGVRHLADRVEVLGYCLSCGRPRFATRCSIRC